MVSATVVNVSAQANAIPMLNGTNFKVWKKNVEIVLGCMDLDLVLRTERPTAITENPNTDKIEKWDRSNCMSLMIMKRSIPEAFRGSITESTNAKKFLKEIEQYKTESAHLASTSRNKNKMRDKDTAKGTPKQKKVKK
ncbi:uncharacterized protein LOC112091335 [Morus notabilis]|uniref:uncharacterized protein LOC112091335 n=1 Tax=Morus notabilis TaxID=981085 RepID=UPI000CED7F12|nr:uncharacterized protein LOC112091335 [Morus notabilis]